MAVRVLEVFADVWCPFAHVGLRRLMAQRARLGRDDLAVRVRAWPLELVNGEPLGAALVAEEVHALREAAAPELFVGFDREHFPSTTLPALALAASAYRQDDKLGEQVSLALRTALFEEGRDIADADELGAIGGAAGMEPPGADAARIVGADWQEGRSRGVIGSPHFFTDGHGFFCPTLAINRVDGQLQISVDAERFAAFASIVFGPS